MFFSEIAISWKVLTSIKRNSEKIENLYIVVYLIKCKCCEKVYIGETGFSKPPWALYNFF